MAGAQELPDHQKELDISTMKPLQAIDVRIMKIMPIITAMVQELAQDLVGAKEYLVDSKWYNLLQFPLNYSSNWTS